MSFEKISASRAVSQLRKEGGRSSIILFYMFFDEMYKRKVLILRAYSSRKIAIDSDSIQLRKWLTKYRENIIKKDKVVEILDATAENIVAGDIKIVSAEGEDMGKKFLSRYNICKRLYNDYKEHKHTAGFQRRQSPARTHPNSVLKNALGGR